MGDIDVYCIQCPSCGNVLDFLGKDEIVCQHCRNKVYRSKEKQNVNMKFEFAFVSDGASYKDKYNDQIKKLGDFSGEFDASLYNSEIDISKFVKQIDTSKFKTKAVKTKVNAVDMARLEGLIQRLHFEYGGENADKVLTSDKALRSLLKEIKDIDENNVYLMFIENFVFMRSLTYDDVKNVLTRKDALEIYSYILPFFKIKEVRDDDIGKLICSYILNTDAADSEKWNALKSVLGIKQKLPYSDFANVFKSVINFDLNLIELSEFEKMFSSLCLGKISNLNEKLDALHAIRLSTLLPNIKVKFYSAVLSTVNDYYDNFEGAMCYLTFISKLTEFDLATKQKMLINNVLSQRDEKIINFTKNFTFEQRMSVMNMLCYGKVMQTESEEFAQFVYNALSKDIYSGFVPFTELIKIFDLLSKVDSERKAEKTKNQLLLELAGKLDCGKTFEVVSFLNYINTAKVEDGLKRDIFALVVSSEQFKPNSQEAMAMFDYLFNLDADYLRGSKREILKGLLLNKIHNFDSFSELDGMLRYLYHLKTDEEEKSEFIVALLQKGDGQQNIVLSFEGIVSFVKYFDSDIRRLKYLFPLYITNRDELFYSLKSLLILYAQGVLNKHDIALAFRVIRAAKMPKIDIQNKNLIHTTIDEYAKEYQIEAPNRRLLKSLKAEENVLKQIANDKNYVDGKESEELIAMLFPYYQTAESFGLIQAKLKVKENQAIYDKYVKENEGRPTSKKKLARVIVSALLMILLPTLIILCAPYFSSVVYLIVMSVFVAVIYLLLLVKIIKDYSGK